MTVDNMNFILTSKENLIGTLMIGIIYWQEKYTKVSGAGIVVKLLPAKRAAHMSITLSPSCSTCRPAPC